MKKIYFFIFIFALSIVAHAQTLDNHANNRLIISFKTGIRANEISQSNNALIFNKSRIDSLNIKYNCKAAAYIGSHKAEAMQNQNTFVLEFASPVDVLKVMDEYQQTGDLEYAEPDYIGHGDGVESVKPNDTRYNLQWALNNTGTFSLSPGKAGADIKMEMAWAVEQGDSNIIVGMLDSGVKMDHPEFNGRIWKNYQEIAGNGIDDDGNGYIDDTQGWNFAYNTNDPKDDYGHGSNTGGIVGATGNNGNMYAGMDWNCKLMICKNLDNNDAGQYSWWANSIYYAVDNGARILNMSEGGGSTSSTLQNAITYAYNQGVLAVISMGNNNNGSPQYPAACTNAFAVGATDTRDYRCHPFAYSSTSGSNYGSHIKVVAPGNYIYGLDYQSNTTYSYYWSGTSQAAPHVTGLAALLLAQKPTRTVTDLMNIITTTADDIVGDPIEDVSGWDQYMGYGRINAYRALSILLEVEQSDEQGFELIAYPNPATNKVFLSGNFFKQKNIQMELYNVVGEKVYSSDIISVNQDFHTSMDVGDYARGVYFLKVQSEGREWTGKVVVK